MYQPLSKEEAAHKSSFSMRQPTSASRLPFIAASSFLSQPKPQVTPLRFPSSDISAVKRSGLPPLPFVQSSAPIQKMQGEVRDKPHPVVFKSNRTGIPAQMKQEFEEKSGLSFEDVRVHFNSEKPAQLQALAYTRGNQVYLGRGQEKHLRHELGHVIQQKQGLVRETSRMSGIPVNDDPRLERAADAPHFAGVHQQVRHTDMPAQCFRFGNFSMSYLHGLLGPLTTVASLALHSTIPENWADLNPARWRIMPHNLLAGFLNAMEESREQAQIPVGGGNIVNIPANYHTSSRHGAHNSIWNAMGRLQAPSNMFNHYTFGGRVPHAGNESRFNSESWERYSWAKGKEYFETIARNAGYQVTWVAHNPFAGVARNNWNVTLDFATSILGSSVGTTMTPPAPGAPAGTPPVFNSTNRVRLAVNYILVPGSANQINAWNGQMFPASGGLIGPALPPPVAGVMPAAPTQPIPFPQPNMYFVPYSLF